MAILPRFRRSQAGMTRLYDRIHRFYGYITRDLAPKIEEVVEHLFGLHPDLRRASVLEYTCGTGLLSLKLASRCRSLTAKDLLSRMLEHARLRSSATGQTIIFSEGDLLSIDEADNSYDYEPKAIHHRGTEDSEKSYIGNRNIGEFFRSR